MPLDLPVALRAAARVLLVAAVAGAAAPTFASHIGEEFDADQQAVQSNDSLLGALRQYESLPANARAAREATLAKQAQMRQQRLIQLLERNPTLAAMRVLPPGLRDRFPAAARAFVEEPDVALRGRVFATVADDFERGVSRKDFKFQPEGSSDTYTLYLGDATGSERDLLGWTGRTVRLKGTRIDGRLLLKKKGDVELVAAEATTTTTTSATGNATPTMSPLITGNRRTLAVMANFTDLNMSCTASDVSNRLFGTSGATVNTLFRDASRDVVAFSGDVAGPFTIAYASTGSCDYSGWASSLDAAARAAGIDLTKYSHITYVTPRNATCGWSGLAYMPGSRSWVQNCTATGVYAHELGHNLSLHHAATPTAEYGDSSDPMGAARTVRTNAANQVMAGWLPTGGVLDVRVGGSYTIAALQPGATGMPQVLRLAKPDTNESYYVSLRTNTGVDASLASTFVNTLSIHRAAGKLPTKTFLLQTVPAGGSFSDPVNGIQVVNQGVANGVATVAVTFGGGSCERQAPAVALDPATATATAGGTVSYKATLTNRNSASCGSASFAIGQKLPSGLTGTLSASSVSVAPGASTAVTWSVKSASTLAEGTHTLDLTATESGAASGTTAHAAYVALAAPTCERQAPAVTLEPASASTTVGGGVAFKATVTNRNGAGCTSSSFGLAQKLPAGVTGSLSAGSLSLAPGASGSVTWNVATATTLAAGSYKLDLTATESGATAGTTAQATLTATAAAGDTTPPALAITSPANGATVSGNSVTLAATASDASGVAAVEFYVGSTLLARDTKAPYSASWSLRKAAKGTHTITVRAIDRVGNAAQQQISVTVN